MKWSKMQKKDFWRHCFNHFLDSDFSHLFLLYRDIKHLQVEKRIRRMDRYLRRPNGNLSSINGQRLLANDERVFTKIIVYTEDLNHQIHFQTNLSSMNNIYFFFTSQFFVPIRKIHKIYKALFYFSFFVIIRQISCLGLTKTNQYGNKKKKSQGNVKQFLAKLYCIFPTFRIIQMIV